MKTMFKEHLQIIPNKNLKQIILKNADTTSPKQQTATSCIPIAKVQGISFWKFKYSTFQRIPLIQESNWYFQIWLAVEQWICLR